MEQYNHENDVYIYTFIYMLWYENDMIMLWYDIFNELIFLWYDMCMMLMLCLETWKHYDMACVTRMIWYDWHAKRRVSMKYNSGIYPWKMW